MKQNLKRELKAFYQAAPPMPRADLIAELKLRAKRNALTPPRDPSLYRFIRTQIRFLNRKLLVLQFLLICLYAVYTITVLQDNQTFLLLVPISPLAVLLGSGELSRSSRCGMAELEFPSRFSLPQILLARLILIAVVDLFSLTCMLCLTAMKTYYSLGVLILYGLVPTLLAAAGSLFFLNHFRSANTQYYISAYCVSLSALGALSINLRPEWYIGTATAVWITVLVLSVAVLAAEIYKLFRDCSKQLEYMKSQ